MSEQFFDQMRPITAEKPWCVSSSRFPSLIRSSLFLSRSIVSSSRFPSLIRSALFLSR